MRITFLQDHLRHGGTEQQTLAIATGLAQAGHRVQLIVFRPGGTLDPQAQAAPVQLDFLKQGPLKTDWFAPGLRKTVQAFRPDCLIPMGRMANCLAGLLGASPRRDYHLIATFRTGRPIPLLYRRALGCCDHIVANSQNALQRLAKDYRIHRPESSSVIYNGCIRDFETLIPLFRNPKSEIRNPKLHLISVSLFRPQKQQIRLIRICRQLPADIDWKLTLAGDGPTRAACQAEAQRLGLADRVHFPGLLKDPRSLYHDGDIALHASDQESLPNFLVEAQMSGLPVIAYDVDGVGETFLDGQSGYLIPHREEATFLEKLTQLSRDKALSLQMSEAARQNARRQFSLAAQTKAYHQLIEKLAASATRI